jgi:hypothetical protein
LPGGSLLDEGGEVRERGVHVGGAMKAPVLALAVGAALAGGCGKGSIADHDSGPPPSVVTFELRNDGIATVYLLQDCLVEYTITSLADPVHVIHRNAGCGCDCSQTNCPVCGACFLGSREIAVGAALNDSWTTEDIINVTRPTGLSCQRSETLPAGPYRIDVPVYGSDADALARTSARTATQSFALPAPGDTVTVALGVSP